MADCPRCGFSPVDGLSDCPRCGVVFSRLRMESVRPASPSPRPRRSAQAWALPLIATALSGAGFLLYRVVVPPRPAPSHASPPQESDLDTSSLGEEAPVPDFSPDLEWTPPPEVVTSAGLEDSAVAARLVAAVEARRIAIPGDLDAVEGLLARHPGSPNLERLAEALFIRAAEVHRKPPPATLALDLLERAVRALPSSFVVRLSLARLEADSGLWPRAEDSASVAITLDPSSPEAHALLGFVRMRQDRDGEAREALEASLSLREDAQTRALLAQVLRSLAAQSGMTEQRLSHFHLRYDGAIHEAVGREVLGVLDRHYSTLVLTFSHQLEAVVPVILYSNRSYYDATGAPAWSGGEYSHRDGRISLPIGGVSGELPPDADRALIHELAHAFVHDMGGPIVPRDIHEGIAQWIEGERCEGGRFAPQDLEAVANGRRNDVAAFYLGALCFVEHLHRERGQAGLNDLLREMSSTRSVDQAFDRVYGRAYSASLATWRSDMRRRHGS